MLIVLSIFYIGTVGFNHSRGCQKCTTIGEYDNDGHHMSFLNIYAPPRTNSEFRSQYDEDHHDKEKSPLEIIEEIDMIKDFIVADELHLLHLGIMKKLLIGWKSGGYNFQTKWSANEVFEISNQLIHFNTFMPVEIHRSIRTLDCISFWKGTEFRTFLLYLGIVVLKNKLPKIVYDHFVKLVCAVTICSDKEYLTYIELASECFKEYVEEYMDIYGPDSISSNVHNLIHATDDISRFGCLTNISTYPFENYLGFIKHLLRQGNLPLEQVANRLCELSNMKNDLNVVSQLPFVKYEQIRNKKKTFNLLNTGLGFVMRNNNGDKWFLTKSNDIVEMQYAVQENLNYFICGSSIKSKYDFFSQPISSSYLNIYASFGKQNVPAMYNLGEIKCKLISLPYQSELVFIPLLHTIIQH